MNEIKITKDSLENAILKDGSFVSGYVFDNGIIKASEFGAHAEGYAYKGSIEASGNGAHAEGWETTASNAGTHAEGCRTHANGEASHAEGGRTESSGIYSHAEGKDTSAFANYSHAEGQETQALGQASHAEGYYTNTNNIGAHSEGILTLAAGYASHAEGGPEFAEINVRRTKSTESVQYKFIEVEDAIPDNIDHGIIFNQNFEPICEIINSSYDSEEGIDYFNVDTPNKLYEYVQSDDIPVKLLFYKDLNNAINIASGIASHVEGVRTCANGTASHAEGYGTSASAYGAHAEGAYTSALKDYSHAGGIGTIANQEAMTAIGKYNDTSEGAYFVVGNGTSGSHKDAFVVNTDGNVQIGGAATAKVNGVSDVYLGCPIGTIVMWAGRVDPTQGSYPPDGWLLCNGDAIKIVEGNANDYDFSWHNHYYKSENSIYRNLVKVIKVLYTNISSTTIHIPNNKILLPDLQQRFPLGAKTGTINTGYNDIGSQTTESTNLGKTGGTSEVELSVWTMPRHDHVLSFSDGTGYTTLYIDGAGEGGPYGYPSTGLTGANKPHNNIPPFLAINFIIKYK